MGIGTATPAAGTALDVNGKVKISAANETTLDVTGGASFSEQATFDQNVLTKGGLTVGNTTVSTTANTKLHVTGQSTFTEVATFQKGISLTDSNLSVTGTGSAIAQPVWEPITTLTTEAPENEGDPHKDIWERDATNPAEIFKDSFGFVHLKGQINAKPFVSNSEISRTFFTETSSVDANGVETTERTEFTSVVEARTINFTTNKKLFSLAQKFTPERNFQVPIILQRQDWSGVDPLLTWISGIIKFVKQPDNNQFDVFYDIFPGQDFPLSFEHDIRSFGRMGGVIQIAIRIFLDGVTYRAV